MTPTATEGPLMRTAVAIRAYRSGLPKRVALRRPRSKGEFREETTALLREYRRTAVRFLGDIPKGDGWS